MLLKGKLWEIFSKWQYIRRVVVTTNDRLDLWDDFNEYHIYTNFINMINIMEDPCDISFKTKTNDGKS